MNTTIKTFEDACAALGIEPKLPGFSATPEKHRKALEAHYKLVIIAEALNEGWQPDWDNNREYKYYPWFEMSPSGFRFFGYDNVCTYSFVGSRLCFKSRELAEYAAETFTELYKDYFLI